MQSYMTPMANGAEMASKQTYTVSEIAKILNVSKRIAYALVKEGHFKTIRIGGAIRIPAKPFESWLNEIND